MTIQTFQETTENAFVRLRLWGLVTLCFPVPCIIHFIIRQNILGLVLIKIKIIDLSLEICLD